MAKFGCPPRFIAMARQFHDGMQARVQNDGDFPEPFEVTKNEVKQVCVMAPTLLSMMFSARLMDAFQDNDTGFLFRYRFDGNFFNLRRLQAKTKVHLLYADYIDKNSNSEAKCKEPWIKSHSHVITMNSQSAQKDRGCTQPSTWKTVQ